MDGMHYEGFIIRPPSEADSILLQVTLGCSHNRCTFCGSYKDKPFAIKDDAVIDADIDYAAKNLQFLRRVFLIDGDALILPQKKLVRILSQIREKMPWVQRVGTYAGARAILGKTEEELAALRDLGLGIIYFGLESGDAQVLQDIGKQQSPERMIEAGRKVRAAGMKLSTMVILGLAGRERSLEHARATGKALSAIDPNYAGVLTLMIHPGTSLEQQVNSGRFELLTSREMLEELREMLVHTHMTRGIFIANHASNYLPLRVKMPADKDKAISMLDTALRGETALKPEWMRGL
ncbi:MAG: radical SAM protein [Syntrophobacteraceae bacterium]|nr:radical SAM protein [Syntrophobacteraceae bacterium]